MTNPEPTARCWLYVNQRFDNTQAGTSPGGGGGGMRGIKPAGGKYEREKSAQILKIGANCTFACQHSQTWSGMGSGK